MKQSKVKELVKNGFNLDDIEVRFNNFRYGRAFPHDTLPRRKPDNTLGCKLCTPRGEPVEGVMDLKEALEKICWCWWETPNIQIAFEVNEDCFTSDDRVHQFIEGLPRFLELTENPFTPYSYSELHQNVSEIEKFLDENGCLTELVNDWGEHLNELYHPMLGKYQQQTQNLPVEHILKHYQESYPPITETLGNRFLINTSLIYFHNIEQQLFALTPGSELVEIPEEILIKLNGNPRLRGDPTKAIKLERALNESEKEILLSLYSHDELYKNVTTVYQAASSI